MSLLVGELAGGAQYGTTCSRQPRLYCKLGAAHSRANVAVAVALVQRIWLAVD